MNKFDGTCERCGVSYAPESLDRICRPCWSGGGTRVAMLQTYNRCTDATIRLHGDERTAAWDSELERIYDVAVRYMPDNYRVVKHQHSLYVVGTDISGWKLDNYVLPRLGQWGMCGVEVTDQSTIDAVSVLS